MAAQIDTERFRQRLEDERQRVADAIEYLHKENPGSLEDDTGELVSGSADNHPADTATETVDREIEAALKRIDEGTYGTCSACGRPVEPERLEHLPWTTRCAQDARGGRG